jgi:hypothetical protein
MLISFKKYVKNIKKVFSFVSLFYGMKNIDFNEDYIKENIKEEKDYENKKNITTIIKNNNLNSEEEVYSVISFFIKDVKKNLHKNRKTDFLNTKIQEKFFKIKEKGLELVFFKTEESLKNIKIFYVLEDKNNIITVEDKNNIITVEDKNNIITVEDKNNIITVEDKNNIIRIFNEMFINLKKFLEKRIINKTKYQKSLILIKKDVLVKLKKIDTFFYFKKLCIPQNEKKETSLDQKDEIKENLIKKILKKISFLMENKKTKLKEFIKIVNKKKINKNKLSEIIIKTCLSCNKIKKTIIEKIITFCYMFINVLLLSLIISVIEYSYRRFFIYY